MTAYREGKATLKKQKKLGLDAGLNEVDKELQRTAQTEYYEGKQARLNFSNMPEKDDKRLFRNF